MVQRAASRPATGALRFTLPADAVITAMLVLLVISYTQVIAAHPEGGGAYAVAKQPRPRVAGLLAAASLFVDYVLTVAVSLAAGAASLGSVFPRWRTTCCGLPDRAGAADRTSTCSASPSRRAS
jgi:amino acid transporter